MRQLLLLLLPLLVLPAAAQSVRTADVVDWRVRAERAAPGAEARLVLDATIRPGWRMYALGSAVGVPLEVGLDGLPTGVEAGPLRHVSPEEGYDDVFKARYPYFAGTGRVVQTLRVGASTARGEHEVTGAVRFAVCDDRICLPPTRVPFRVPLVVE